MKSMILVGLMMALLTACTKNIEFDGFDPTTSIVKWVFTGDKKKLKRTSVHITPSAIPCTATFEAESPVEVWSLWPCKSTCTEITGFYMN